MYEKAYTYGNSAWGDQLTAFNGAGITYDEIGNPLTYYNGAVFSWMGRQLTGAVYSGNTYTFTYDSNGLRTSKTVNGVTTKYYYVGSLLLGEETPDGYTLYIYDANGSPIGMQYWSAGSPEDEWDTYIFEKNLQGDVVAVYTATGERMVTYSYDAWGNTDIVYTQAGADLHVNETDTITIGDAFPSLIKIIMGWFGF